MLPTSVAWNTGDGQEARLRQAAVQRRTIAVLVITQIVGTVGVGVAPSIGILLAGEVTESEAWAGLARTASTLGAALFSLPLGSFAARRGRRLALATGWWVAALGSAILVAAAQWSLVVPLFAGLFLIGSGSAVSLQARFAATDLAEPHRKARSLALVVWVGTAGMVLGPNLGAPGQLIGGATGLSVYAGAFLIAAMFLAAAGTVVFTLLRPDPLLVLARIRPTMTDDRPGKRQGRIRTMVGEVRSNRPARIAAIAILSAQVVMVAIMTMTPVHIMHEGGSVNIVGITISLHIAGMYALAPVVGWMTDRFGNRSSIYIGVAILTLSLILSAAQPDKLAMMVISLILLGIGWSFVNVAGSALFSLTVSDEVRASAQGGVDALSNLCGASAAFAAGPLLAVSDFTTLSILSMIVLLPLAALLVRPIGVQAPNVQPRTSTSAQD